MSGRSRTRDVERHGDRDRDREGGQRETQRRQVHTDTPAERLEGLEQIDRGLGEAAYDLGAGPLTTFRRVTLPLILPAVVSALLIAFTTSFDEYAVASFLAGTRQTFPIYLYSALRFPTQLPQVIAVAVVVLCASLAVVVAAELWRRRAEARLEAPA